MRSMEHIFIFAFSNILDKDIREKAMKRLTETSPRISRAPLVNEIVTIGDQDFRCDFIRHRPDIQTTTIYLGEALGIGNVYSKESYSHIEVIES